MKLGSGQLAALAAVVREGSFDAAAKILHVTPSAISQRVKQLEEQIGAVLIVRASPCTPTTTGEAVYRHALQLEVLERDLIAAVAPETSDPAEPPSTLSIAVNADSLSTWLVPALEAFAREHRVRLDVSTDDEGDTDQWLRSGRVVGVVTSSSKPVQGCAVQPLGVMRYVATASPRFAKKWIGKRFSADALVRAPCLAYNRKDQLCEQFFEQVLGRQGASLHPHYLPSPEAYVAATLKGLGWGLNPLPLVEGAVKRGRLVDLRPGDGIDVPLYWQQWSIASSSIEALASCLHRFAADVLEPA